MEVSRPSGEVENDQDSVVEKDYRLKRVKIERTNLKIEIFLSGLNNEIIVINLTKFNLYNMTDLVVICKNVFYGFKPSLRMTIIFYLLKIKFY